uniref:Uncharacterized protein n=1 Tax=Plectus sambesii TaxID=2011161 RepID=A0A914WY78_9BILA
MNITVLKIILLVVMLVLTLLFGVLPIKVIEYLACRGPRQRGTPNKSSLLLSLLSCFAGGVFLAICFLDLMPDAREALANLVACKNWTIEYPIVELLTCIGFFLVYLVEELSTRVFHSTPTIHDQSLVTKDNTIWSVDQLCDREVPSETKTATSEKHDTPTGGKSAIVRTLTFMLALTFHSTLEGFAFGVQDTELSVTALFFGLMVHKSVVAFSVGMRLIRSHPKARWLVVANIVFFALMSPLGAVVGILIENSPIDTATKEMVSTILISLSLGTFIYITFFEILSVERDNDHPNLAKLIATVLGFAIIAGIMTVSS